MAEIPMKRILVHLQKAGETSPTLAKFTQSIVGYFGGTENKQVKVGCALREDRLVLYETDNEEEQVPLKRPTFCPITHLSPEASLPADVQSRGVDVGVVVVLETRDQQVLLTRRARHMRTFPRVWVPPGGHIEQGETLLEAGRRELHEETGLHLPECHGNVFGLWESVFPPMLNLGLPKRHHVVVYVHLRTQQSQHVLQDRLTLQAAEVDGAAWLDRSLVEAIVASDQEDEGARHSNSTVPKTFKATVLNPDGQVLTEDLSTTMLLIPSLQARQDQERVSTGTKFALAQLIK